MQLCDRQQLVIQRHDASLIMYVDAEAKLLFLETLSQACIDEYYTEPCTVFT